MAGKPGYAGKVVKIDLSSRCVTIIPTADYSSRFLGGRGIAAKIYWDEVPPETDAFAPENRLILITGPLAGFPGLAGSRWQICGKSPSTEPQHFSYCNLGGTWGAELKFAGYDGIVIEGKADRPAYIFIKDDTVEIRDAYDLWGLGAIETRYKLKEKLGQSAKVVAIGPAGENLVVFASLLADDDSSGSSGFGAVFGAKNLKAVAVIGSKRTELKAADDGALKQIRAELNRRIKIDVPSMLNTMTTFSGFEVKRKTCWGCVKGCMRGLYTPREGKPGKFMCQSSWYYRLAVGVNLIPGSEKTKDTPRKGTGEFPYEQPDGEVSFLANKLCDTYGLDTMVMEPLIRWLLKCYEAGILSEANTLLPLSKAGSAEFIETLTRKISLREGFGDILARGTAKAASYIGNGAERFLDGKLSKAGEILIYEPRMYITTGLFYAMEPRRPINLLHQASGAVSHWLHDHQMKQGHFSTEALKQFGERFFGSALALDLSTYDGKALAAKRIQDREYAGESMIVCDSIWPVPADEESGDYVGDLTIYNRVLSAVTGMELDEKELYRIGERIFNVQRAVLVREGHRGRIADTLPDYFFTTPLEGVQENPECLAPGKDGEAISRKGEVVDRLKFEKMKDEYYQLRGWDKTTGLQTQSKLKELELQDIASGLETRGLIV